jgi:hypothetical protein
MNEPCWKCGSKRRQENRDEAYGVLLLQYWKCMDCGTNVKTKTRRLTKHDGGKVRTKVIEG